MKKKYIVKMREEFNCLIKTGICSKNKYFVLYHLPNNKSYDRFGISVGKKIGNAVTRNKYKRKIRSIIDKYRKDYIISKLSRFGRKSDFSTKKGETTWTIKPNQGKRTRKNY